MEKEKSDKIAKMILEVIPLAMREIRTEMRAAAKSELTVPQFRILASIFRGNDKAKDIATHQGVSQAAISKMIDGLVVRGLVERKQAEDRRHYKLSLTEQGQTFFSATQKITQAALRKKIIKMSPEEKLSLESGLKMLQKLLLVLPILFMTIPTHATTLSWNQCIERAARDNAEFQVAKNNLQAAMAQQDGSYSGFLPQVSASANYSYDKSENAGRVDGPSSSYSTSLNATQNLFSGLQDKAKVDQAKANVGVSQSNLRNAQAKLSFDLKSAYMGLMFAQNSIKLTKDIMDRREANLKLVELRFTSGRENKGSLLLSKAYFEQAKYDHLQAMHSLELAQVQLQKVLGVQENLEQIEVTEAIPTSRPSSQIDIKQLVLDTPDYQQSIAQEQSASAGIVLARSSFFPSLTLTGSNGNTGDQWYPQNNHWSVGVGITFPLFNGGKDYFGTKAAFANFRSASFGKQNSLQLGMTKIKQSYNAYLEAVQKLEVDRAFVDATEIRAKVAREKYNNGLLSFDDWDTIENDLINRQKTLIQSERDRVIAEASWEQTQGKGVINE